MLEHVGVGECTTKSCGGLVGSSRNLLSALCLVLGHNGLTSVLVSCMACSTIGMTLPSSLATYSSAPGLTRPSIAFSAATFVLHPLESSKTRHNTSKTILDPSTDEALINEVMALLTALLTG